MDTERPRISYREYYCEVWAKARKLEGSQWVRYVGLQVVPTVIGIILLGAVVGDVSGFTIHGIVNEERTGLILAGLGLLIIGVIRMIFYVLQAPAVLDAERKDALTKSEDTVRDLKSARAQAGKQEDDRRKVFDVLTEGEDLYNERITPDRFSDWSKRFKHWVKNATDEIRRQESDVDARRFERYRQDDSCKRPPHALGQNDHADYLRQLGFYLEFIKDQFEL